MATYKFKDFHKLGTKIKKNVKKAANFTTAKVSAQIVKDAKRMAPVHTGETRRGIKRRKRKNGWTVESWVPGEFKQNMFANQTQPYFILNFKEPNRYYQTPQSVIYRGPAISSGGNPIRWTARKGRFFDIAVELQRIRFPKIARKNTIKALRVRL